LRAGRVGASGVPSWMRRIPVFIRYQESGVRSRAGVITDPRLLIPDPW